MMLGVMEGKMVKMMILMRMRMMIMLLMPLMMMVMLVVKAGSNSSGNYEDENDDDDYEDDYNNEDEVDDDGCQGGEQLHQVASFTWMGRGTAMPAIKSFSHPLHPPLHYLSHNRHHHSVSSVA